MTMQQATMKIYTAGTLRYTAGGVFWLFFWMLLGSFVFSMLERIIPILLPLTLNQYGCSNETIGLLVGSLPGLEPFVQFVDFKALFTQYAGCFFAAFAAAAIQGYGAFLLQHGVGHGFETLVEHVEVDAAGNMSF